MINYSWIVIVSLSASTLFVLDWAMRRTRRGFCKRNTAAQLRRGAAHINKVAVTVNIHVMQGAISRLLLEEAARMLERAVALEPKHRSTQAALRECNAMRAAIDATKPDFSSFIVAAAPCLDSELLLLEAKMHLTEASRLLGGMEKRGLLSTSRHQVTITALQDAQCALDLHLSMMQAMQSIKMDSVVGVDLDGHRDFCSENLNYS